MPNPYNAPETHVRDVAEKLKAGADFVLMDVRELDELEQAHIENDKVVVVPLSKLAQEQVNALPLEVQDKKADIVVMCHTGMRSAQVTAWLLQQGWKNVRNMEGGIDAYARQIDPSVGFY